MSTRVDESRLAAVQAAISADIEAKRYDGAALSVHVDGESVLRSVQGYRHRASGTALEPDSIFVTFSSGKQMTVVSVLQAVERGLLHLHTPVADVIPEFGVNGKDKMNLGHLLTHTSGVASMPPPTAAAAMFGNLQMFVDAICQTPPESRPGERVRYSITPAHAVMAEMVRRVDGGTRTFRQIMQEDVFQPLGMHDSALGLPDELRPRLCPVVVADRSPGLLDPAMLEAFNDVLSPEMEMPAGGYVTTIDDFAKFAEMLRNGGALNGAHILSPATIELVSRNYTGDKPNDIWDYAVEARGWPVFPAYLGLGFFLRGEGVHPTPFGSLASPRTFGGVGAGSTTFFIDPEKRLSYAFLSTGLLEETRSTERHQRLADLVHAAIVE
ncbi:MAG: serine hydrolase domain-containing protein [Pseudomonadales bacterium]|jgi:CubicO group peptidase (beta-lactamase class C family)|nr:serine hydrolase domain-containing protein [Pseudomonadales bacterium]MDP6469761.1 serine hydrolase domain-containing protein [Pseudomonadales bacterium]MDP6827637.1 serine hydrolase domain-containing protein [Pseudomonadales bacterium]MDP6971922.1 serine hydrolase domain-containing protein [Pseudomonadales bacterium]|tara:strand:- start:302 stop:1450 length:1149 start_codon:yes stop_codon:yes gene_type:complete